MPRAPADLPAWLPDELAHAGRESLDIEHVRRYDESGSGSDEAVPLVEASRVHVTLVDVDPDEIDLERGRGGAAHRRQAMGVVSLRDGVDHAWPGKGVVHFSRVGASRTQSRMGRIVGTPEYRSMAIRNWATTTRVLGLLDDRAR